MKSTISSKTTRLNQLVKHYNQLATRLNSIGIENYQNGMQDAYCHTVKTISDEMDKISAQIDAEKSKD